MNGKNSGYLASALFTGFEPLRYTGRVVETGFGQPFDAIDGTSHEFMTVSIPVPGTKPGAEWRNRTFKIYMDEPMPKTGELVELEIHELFGLPDEINYVKTSSAGQKVKPVRNFEILPY